MSSKKPKVDLLDKVFAFIQNTSHTKIDSSVNSSTQTTKVVGLKLDTTDYDSVIEMAVETTLKEIKEFEFDLIFSKARLQAE